MSRAKKKATSASCLESASLLLREEAGSNRLHKKYSKNLAAKKFGVDRARVIEWVKQEDAAILFFPLLLDDDCFANS
uniref:Brinker DNA-binding domain-containing protein n=1 Tax=Ditylenchus dipsaci TaxID=166011 RepID=A0A915DWH8_9BILA